jgi:hypothetical protein
MHQKFVLLKGNCGRPHKGVFMTAENSEIIVGDPDRLSEIEAGKQTMLSVSPERVFNFEEDAYRELLHDWESSTKTSADAWTRLGHFELPKHRHRLSCRHWN